MSEQPAFEQFSNNRKMERRSVELDDLATPYFRKSVSYARCRTNEALEQKIADYLELKGVVFVERGAEALYLHGKKDSGALSRKVSEKLTSITDTLTDKSRLSSFDLGGNGLFLRRKMSSIRNTQESQ